MVLLDKGAIDTDIEELEALLEIMDETRCQIITKLDKLRFRHNGNYKDYFDRLKEMSTSSEIAQINL